MNIHKSQLFWGSLGTRVLTHPHLTCRFFQSANDESSLFFDSSKCRLLGGSTECRFHSEIWPCKNDGWLDSKMILDYIYTHTGWWFQTRILFSISYMGCHPKPIDEVIFFKMSTLHHQADDIGLYIYTAYTYWMLIIHEGNTHHAGSEKRSCQAQRSWKSHQRARSKASVVATNLSG